MRGEQGYAGPVYDELCDMMKKWLFVGTPMSSSQSEDTEEREERVEEPGLSAMATHMHVPEEHEKNEGDAEERASEETEKPCSQMMNLQKVGSLSDKSGERDAWKQAYHEEMERTLKERFAVVVQELS